MLRPASLPPREGLSTSRFGPRGLPRCRRPATRRSDAYRGGTCTRWRSAARLVDPLAGFAFAVTAHHDGNLPARCDELPITLQADQTAHDLDDAHEDRPVGDRVGAPGCRRGTVGR